MIRLSATRIQWLVASALAMLAAGSSTAHAQSRALFSDQRATSSGAAIARSGSDPAVIRSRRATADVSLLADVSRTNGGGFGGAQLAARSVDLNLFTNVDLVAHLDRIEVVESLGFAWVG